MIIRLIASNILSFGSEVVFSLMPGKYNLKTEHISHKFKKHSQEALKAAIIYGMNASGKTNLVKLIALLKTIVTQPVKEDEDLPVEPFRSSSIAMSNSKIEIEIDTGLNNYAYGMILNPKVIVEEWLFMMHPKGDKMIFERKTTKNGVFVTIENVKFRNKEEKHFVYSVGEGTPENKAFLQECIDNNVTCISPVNVVYDWFRNKLNVYFPAQQFSSKPWRGSFSNEIVEEVASLTNYANRGGAAIPNALLENVIRKLNDLMNKPAIAGNPHDEKMGEGVFPEVQQDTENMSRPLSGTIHWEDHEKHGDAIYAAEMICGFLDLVKHESVYLMDTVEHALPPALVRCLLEYFNSKITEINSQLIITTYQSELLDMNYFRKDEVWFMERNENGCSHLYNLLDYGVRLLNDARKGYLNGRFGELPFSTNPKHLNW